MFSIEDHFFCVQGHPEYNKEILFEIVDRVLGLGYIKVCYISLFPYPIGPDRISHFNLVDPIIYIPEHVVLLPCWYKLMITIIVLESNNYNENKMWNIFDKL